MNYRLERITSSRSPVFEEAYTALSREFGPRGELERREVVASWLDDPPDVATSQGVEHAYHLLVARNDRGDLAGVRDCHVLISRATRLAVVYLAHALVLPGFRRTGLGGLLRREPVDIAERELSQRGLVDFDVVLGAEMEPIVASDPSSMIRLIAYGKDGFRAISPSVLPYWQPDFRLLPAPDDAEDAVPLPLLAVVRWVGHEASTVLPRRLARAFVRNVYAVFATHVHPGHLSTLEQRMLRIVDTLQTEDVPLLSFPTSTEDRAAIAALSTAAVLSQFPEEHR